MANQYRNFSCVEDKPEFEEGLSDMVIPEDKPAEFVCDLSKPDVDEKDIKWFKGDKEIEPSDKFVIKKKGRKLSLVVHDVDVEDAGEYTVKVKDTESKAVLSVEGMLHRVQVTLV